MTGSRFRDGVTLRKRLLIAAAVIIAMLCYGWLACAWLFGLPVACLCTLGCKTSGGLKRFVLLVWLVHIVGIQIYCYRGYH